MAPPPSSTEAFLRRHLVWAASLSLIVHFICYLIAMVIHYFVHDGARFWWWLGGLVIFSGPCLFCIGLHGSGDDGLGFRATVRKWQETKNLKVAVMISFLLDGYNEVTGDLAWHDILVSCTFFGTCALWAWCYCPPALVAEIVHPLLASSLLHTIGFLYDGDARGFIFMAVLVYSGLISFVPRVPADPSTTATAAARASTSAPRLSRAHYSVPAPRIWRT